MRAPCHVNGILRPVFSRRRSSGHTATYHRAIFPGLPAGGRQRAQQTDLASVSTRDLSSCARHFSSVVLTGANLTSTLTRTTNVVVPPCVLFRLLPTGYLHLVSSFVRSAPFAVSALPSEAIYPPSTAARANPANGCRNQTSASKGYGRFRAYPCVDERVFAACAWTRAFGLGCGCGSPHSFSKSGRRLRPSAGPLPSNRPCLRSTAAAACWVVSLA
jgi:hypothetical protein